MIDLRRLADHWSEEGARSVFESLVTQCVNHEYGNARGVRPDPGDDGIDTIVRDFGESEARVWQSKYFPGRIEASQKSQVRKSFKTCMESDVGPQVRLWTLCIPHLMSTPELKWWTTWRKKQMSDHNLRIELWDQTEFVRFYLIPRVQPAFDFALRARGELSSSQTVAAIRATAPPQLSSLLPKDKDYSDAVFVRKLEAAGVASHKAARIAFYNFELVRAYISEAKVPGDQAALEDLLARVLDIWETEFHSCPGPDFGPKFYARVSNKIAQETGGALESTLSLGRLHKKGALHYWADLCEAGWLQDFKIALSDEETAETS